MDEKTEKGRATGVVVRAKVDCKDVDAAVGDVVIVEVPDAGGAPVTLEAVLPEGLKKLAQVQHLGDRVDGRLVMGGGSTWLIVAAEKKGEHGVKLTYSSPTPPRDITQVKLTVKVADKRR